MRYINYNSLCDEKNHFSLQPKKIKILIEDKCRKTPYTGDGQTKIFVMVTCAFICVKFKPNTHVTMR